MTRRAIRYRKVRVFPPVRIRKPGRCGCLITARGEESWEALEGFHLNISKSCKRRVQREEKGQHGYIPGQ